ncbi:MAG: hypothetical protein AAGG01_23365 [Planctomycetota bacterium]
MTLEDPVLGADGHHAPGSEMFAVGIELLGGPGVPASAEEEHDRRAWVARELPLGPKNVQAEVVVTDGLVDDRLGLSERGRRRLGGGGRGAR